MKVHLKISQVYLGISSLMQIEMITTGVVIILQDHSTSVWTEYWYIILGDYINVMNNIHLVPLTPFFE